MDYFRFWNDRTRLYRASFHQKLRNKHCVQVPGCLGDHTDRGQPERFAKWYKLPDTAHRLFWRTHPKK